MQVADVDDIGRRRRRRRAAQIAMLAGVSGNEIGLARRLVAGYAADAALWQMTENGSTAAPLAAIGIRPSRMTCRATA